MRATVSDESTVATDALGVSTRDPFANFHAFAGGESPDFTPGPTFDLAEGVENIWESLFDDPAPGTE